MSAVLPDRGALRTCDCDGCDRCDAPEDKCVRVVFKADPETGRATCTDCRVDGHAPSSSTPTTRAT